MNPKKLTGGKAIANTKTRTVRRMAKEHKANPELAILAHSIRNGSNGGDSVKLNPYHPPKHITFEMLWATLWTTGRPKFTLPATATDLLGATLPATLPAWFAKTTYVGAFDATTDWTATWAEFSPQSVVYIK